MLSTVALSLITAASTVAVSSLATIGSFDAPCCSTMSRLTCSTPVLAVARKSLRVR